MEVKWTGWLPQPRVLGHCPPKCSHHLANRHHPRTVHLWPSGQVPLACKICSLLGLGSAHSKGAEQLCASLHYREATGTTRPEEHELEAYSSAHRSSHREGKPQLHLRSHPHPRHHLAHSGPRGVCANMKSAMRGGWRYVEQADGRVRTALLRSLLDDSTEEERGKWL